MWELPDYSRRDHLSRFGPLHHRTPRILPELGINQNQKQLKTLERLTHLLLLMPITTPTAMGQLNRCYVGSKQMGKLILRDDKQPGVAAEPVEHSRPDNILNEHQTRRKLN